MSAKMKTQINNIALTLFPVLTGITVQQNEA